MLATRQPRVQTTTVPSRSIVKLSVYIPLITGTRSKSAGLQVMNNYYTLLFNSLCTLTDFYPKSVRKLFKLCIYVRGAQRVNWPYAQGKTLN